MGSTQDAGHKATFFISTGRCATQWLTDKLSQHYGDLAVTLHEPIQTEYDPRRYFSAYSRKETPVLSPAIEGHFRFIEETLRTRDYIETGWPVYGALPFFVSRLAGRVRVVHLYRNPIETAASLATHQVYSKGPWTDALSIRPSDEGVAQPELKGARWEQMTEYDRCVFWWTEINNFGLRLRRDFPEVPWLAISFEEIFQTDGREALSRLLKFLNLPVRQEFLNSREQKTDRFHLKSDEKFNAISLDRYPKAVEVMKVLGYTFDASILPKIQKRYTKTFLHRLASRTRRSVMSLFTGLGSPSKEAS